jgi:hypothetical protein
MHFSDRNFPEEFIKKTKLIKNTLTKTINAPHIKNIKMPF